MPLHLFLNCAYALIVDGFRQHGVDLPTAADRTRAAMGLPHVEEETPAAAEFDNEAAFKAMQQLMGGRR